MFRFLNMRHKSAEELMDAECRENPELKEIIRRSHSIYRARARKGSALERLSSPRSASISPSCLPLDMKGEVKIGKAA
ncbi:unnamed protein product [Urochloa humidicola]